MKEQEKEMKASKAEEVEEEKQRTELNKLFIYSRT